MELVDTIATHELAVGYNVLAWPGAQAREMPGMLRYKAHAVLGSIHGAYAGVHREWIG